MKKVIRLTEKQLEDIVRRVIAEQDGQEGAQYTDESGVTYKLPGITDSEKWGTLVNWALNGSIAEAMDLLRKYGLKPGNRRMDPNPMDVNIKWDTITSLNDPRQVNADRLISMFTNALIAVGKTGYTDKRYWQTPQFTNVMTKEGTKPADAVALYPNFWDVLENILKLQLPKIA